MTAGASWDTPLTWDDLSSRQQEVMFGVARGLSNQEIADELGIALPTVRNIIAMRGLGLPKG